MQYNYKTILTFILFFLSTTSYLFAQTRPNIVVIVSDDQGYADISYNPAHKSHVDTPNMDNLANNGIYFTNAYLTGNTCAPSRAAIMTGRYQQRESIYDSGEGGSGLSLDATIFPEFLPTEYTSAAFGKWHLGLTSEYSPASRGFDEFFGFLGRGAHDYFDLDNADEPLYRGLETTTAEGYLTNLLTDEAVAFIEREKDNPFFCYLAYNAVHTPAQAPAEDIARYNTGNDTRNILMAMLYHLDNGVGKVVQTLKDNNIWDNTIVIFLTDNGGARAMEADNAPLRGSKQTNYEGGIRTPFIFSWPNRYPNHKEISTPISAMDILPTILDATETALPTTKPFDGKSMLPLMDGTVQKTHDKLYWNEGGIEGEWAVRDGNWKLVAIEDNIELFDLSTDPSESTNLANQNPEIVSSMISDYNEWLDEMPEPKSQPKQWAPDINSGQLLTLFNGYYYNGNNQIFNSVGVYNSSDLSAINDNGTQSILLAPGYSAYGFTEDNLEGKRYLFTSSSPYLGAFDQELSSLYIFESNGIDGKNITVTSSENDSNPENIFDNDNSTYWDSVGNGDSITFSWCEPESLSGIDMAFKITGGSRTYTFDVETSLDGTNWTRVLTNAQNGGTNTSLETFNFSETTAQYLRIIGRGNSSNNQNHYTEIAFNYGTGTSNDFKIEAEDYSASVNTNNTVTDDCEGVLDVSQTTEDATLSYDINLTQSASSIDIRCNPLNRGAINVLLDNVNIGEFEINNSMIDDTYKTLNIPVNIPTGSHTLTLNFVARRTNFPVMGNFNWIKLIGADGSLSTESIFKPQFEIALFPNPANNSLNITSNISIEELSVIDLKGKKINEIRVNLKNYTLDTSSLKAGMYFLMLKSEGAIQYKKFVKK